MTKKQKLWLSQSRHSRLSNLYYNNGAFRNKRLCIYHAECADRQQKLGRILTSAEKRKIYNTCLDNNNIRHNYL